MRSHFLSGIACVVVSFFPLSAWGQAKPEFESRYNKRFLKESSFLGKQAPDVNVYDASGNPFRLSQSRGKHTVVVFGCLT